MTPAPKRWIRELSALLVCATVSLLGAPGASLAAGGSRTVSYLGVSVVVPASWPVIAVNARSTVCVRFDRHAVYLGTPGRQESCPQHLIGRTEAILIQPEVHRLGGGAGPGAGAGLTAADRNGALTPTSTALAAGAGGSMLRIVEPNHGVLVTATWSHDPQLIRSALHLTSLAAAARATNGHRPAAATSVLERQTASSRPARRSAHAASLTPAPATPGEVYTGLGFDMCSAPSKASLSAWATGSQYQALGIYIGGVNAACSQTNLTAAWVSAESAAGWHLIPTYVGLQAPGACSGCAAISAGQAAAEGAAAAQDAVYQAQALGIGTGNPIYYDMESYSRSTAVTATVLTFLSAWTTQLHSSGYLSGVYSSAASGVTDLVDAQGTAGFTEPDEVWFAHWATPPTTTDAYVPATDWVNHQRLHQYSGGHNETFEGVTLNIDSDYLDAATAAAGSTTPFTAIATAPTLAVQPQPDGSIQLSPVWSGATGVASWQVSGGPSTTVLAPIETVPAAQAGPVVVNDNYAYFSVAALNSAGTVMATSQPTPTPASIAVYGKSAFAPTGPSSLTAGTVSVPVSCLNTSPCALQAALFRGKKRLAHSEVQTISSLGGVIRLPVTRGVLKALAGGTKRKVQVTVSSVAGAKATRSLELIPFTTWGQPPARSTGSNADLRILAKSVFVSNGWVGGVLVQCTALTPCTASTRVTTRGGQLISTPRTQTVGSGQIAYLGFRLTATGHALLRSAVGNQLPARVAVRTTVATAPLSAAPVIPAPVIPAPVSPTPATAPASTPTGASPPTGAHPLTGAVAAVASAGTPATALVSLESYR